MPPLFLISPPDQAMHSPEDAPNRKSLISSSERSKIESKAPQLLRVSPCQSEAALAFVDTEHEVGKTAGHLPAIFITWQSTGREALALCWSDHCQITQRQNGPSAQHKTYRASCQCVSVRRSMGCKLIWMLSLMHMRVSYTSVGIQLTYLEQHGWDANSNVVE